MTNTEHTISFGKYSRLYYLRAFAKCGWQCKLCVDFKPRASLTKDLDNIRASINKALSGEYQGVIVPCNLLFSLQVNEIFKLLAECNLKIIIQIPQDLVQEKTLLQRLQELHTYNYDLNIILDNLSFWDGFDQQFFQQLCQDLTFTMVGKTSTDFMKILSTMPAELFNKVFFYFPLKLSFSDEYLTCEQIHKTVKKIKNNFPGISVANFPGIEIFEPRISEVMNLEPIIDPNFTKEIPNSKINMSVIIPSFNNGKHLLHTLKHLLRQDYPSNKFEIVIIDDGSTDDSQGLILEYLSSKAVNLKYIYFPRPKPRMMGDGQYRAGISRNLGVKHAKGDILCFLDCDILVSPSYLREVEKKLQHWDVIQARRFDLKYDITKTLPNYEQIDIENHVINGKSFDQNYWQKFNVESKEEGWQELKCFWKYACSHSLSLRADLFKRSGWFKKTFIYYGFEDTDLGYRLAKAGARFCLADLKVYHLHHPKDRSEYFHSEVLRKVVLAKTAVIFYHNWLDAEIFEEFTLMIKFAPKQGSDPFTFLAKMISRLLKLIKKTFVSLRRSDNNVSEAIGC